MGKPLLSNLTGNTSADENAATVTDTDQNKALAELMQEMKAPLEDAAKDLLKPRQEVIDRLLGKVLH